MNALDFLADLETKPRWLNLLADRFAVANPFATVPRDVDRVLLLGMGSSRYAASVELLGALLRRPPKIGRASCRERVYGTV